MESFIDVLEMLVRISPVREEAVVNKALGILESAREKVDGLAHGIESKVTSVEQAVAPVAPTAPVTPASATPPVAGL